LTERLVKLSNAD